ncbi:hypothetical protein COP1_028355 [Malus domestica]
MEVGIEQRVLRWCGTDEGCRRVIHCGGRSSAVRAPVALISQRALLNTEVKKSSSYSFTRRKDCIAAAVLIDSGRKQLYPLCFWPAAPAYASGRPLLLHTTRANTCVTWVHIGTPTRAH